MRLRLVDADELDNMLAAAQAECKRNGGNFRFGVLSTVRENIKTIPAVEAVPVEWLNQKYAENEPGEEKDYDYFLWDAITYVLTKWQNEQGARWWLISCGR